MNAPFKTPDAEAPLWDLSDLYAARDDARVGEDLARARALVDRMNGLQGQLIARRADAGGLGEVLDQAITLYEQASDVLGALGAYAFLAASTARDDPGAQGFEADVREKITAPLDAQGNLVRYEGATPAGIALTVGAYRVEFTLNSGNIPSFDIEVTAGHTQAAPLDLVTAAPYRRLASR